LRRQRAQHFDESNIIVDENVSSNPNLQSSSNSFADGELAVLCTVGATMKLRAEIAVDIVAEDYVDAARYQKSFEEFLKDLQSRYPDATLQIRERRERRPDEECGASHRIAAFHRPG
jgi:hypothetical protein